MTDAKATAALVIAAREGDGAAFSLLAREYLRPAYLTALSIVGRPNDADDVAQDALMAALEHIGTCREPQRFVAWLLQIVRNRALKCLERRKLRDVPREEPIDRSVTTPNGEVVGLRRRLLEALSHVSAVQREIVLLHDIEEWTHLEIAEALGISVVMSRQHLFQARRILRERLAEPPQEHEEHRGGYDCEGRHAPK